jgi:hypothetical protein
MPKDINLYLRPGGIPGFETDFPLGQFANCMKFDLEINLPISEYFGNSTEVLSRLISNSSKIQEFIKAKSQFQFDNLEHKISITNTIWLQNLNLH